MLTRRGGPEVLEDVDLPLRDPGPGEARVRVIACGAGGTDVLMRRGYYPFAPKIPFVPGYDVVGEVDAVGEGVTGFERGTKVDVLENLGGHAEIVSLYSDDVVLRHTCIDARAVVA